MVAQEQGAAYPVAMRDVHLTAEDLALLRTLRRYLALDDPLGARATVPNIVRYIALRDSADEAAQRGAGRQAAGYRLQQLGLERQHVVSRFVTVGVVLLLLTLTLVEGVRAWSDFSRIVPGLQAALGAATSPDFSKVDASFLVPDPLRGRFTPDPERAFAPVIEDYRQRSQAGIAEVRGAVTGTAVHLLLAVVLGVGALVFAVLQPHELVRRWLLPLLGRLLLLRGP
ncbi:MAG: hypothetical protein KatS3mg060_3341 [Dehalococcoidia bacterium]|nr:MAG: hypothetical protein KatS3mg060_3341 [Dehalococcoidia bacterium]